MCFVEINNIILNYPGNAYDFQVAIVHAREHMR